MICNTCGSKENVAVRSRIVRKDLSEYVRYICRACNTKRCKIYRAENKEKISLIGKKTYRKHPDKHAARTTLNMAIKAGKINRPAKCEVCKVACTPDGHHSDYTKPLQVQWLCRVCHAQEHKNKL